MIPVGVDAFTAAKTEFHTAIDGEDAAYKKSLQDLFFREKNELTAE